MDKIEKTLGSVSILGMALTLFNVSIGPTLAVFSIIFLIPLYFFFGFALLNEIRFRHILRSSSNSNIGAHKMVAGVLIGILFSVIIAATIFKFQYWRGNHITNPLGVYCLILLLALPLISTYAYKAKKAFFSTGIVVRTVLIGSVGAVILLTPNAGWVKFRYDQFPDYGSAVEQFENNPNTKALQKVNFERDRMNSKE